MEYVSLLPQNLAVITTYNWLLDEEFLHFESGDYEVISEPSDNLDQKILLTTNIHERLETMSFNPLAP